MSILKIKVANFFAKQSCPAWQSHRFIRKICRKTYRFIMEFRAKDYPYADPDFAPWPESDGEFYTLITDSANFVIRRSTSYIAWMMKKYCGGWPKLPTPGERLPGEHKFDAKHWDEVLKFNCWQRSAGWPIPTEIDVEMGRHYIGIIPDEGEFGQLVWFVDLKMGFVDNPPFEFNMPYSWHVWTYKDFQKKDYSIPASRVSKIIWYREPAK